MFIYIKAFHSVYQEASRLGTHHSWKCTGKENAIFTILPHLQKELKDRQCTRKDKNVVRKLKNRVLKYCSQISFDYNLYDTEKITPNFAMLNSDCLALTF